MRSWPVSVKGRAFGSPLARGLKPQASTAEIPPGFAVLIREAMKAGKPGVSLPFTKRLSQGGARVAVETEGRNRPRGPHPPSGKRIPFSAVHDFAVEFGKVDAFVITTLENGGKTLINPDLEGFLPVDFALHHTAAFEFEFFDAFDLHDFAALFHFAAKDFLQRAIAVFLAVGDLVDELADGQRVGVAWTMFLNGNFLINGGGEFPLSATALPSNSCREYIANRLAMSIARILLILFLLSGKSVIITPLASTH